MQNKIKRYIQLIIGVNSVAATNNYTHSSILNGNVCSNFNNLKTIIFILPLLILSGVILYLAVNQSLNINGYIAVQKDYFYSINKFLGQYPILQTNLTQLGDGLICLSLLSFFIVFAPKIWEAVVTSFLISLLLTVFLKKNLKVPRPAAVFDSDSFYIIGRKLEGMNSCPSGHSITMFIVLSTLMFAFMPRTFKFKIIWIGLLFLIGLKLVLTRVGVGAHYPLDTIIGAILGYLTALLGIFISRRYKLFQWMNNKNIYPLFIVVFIAGSLILINKIAKEQLIVFYIALICLIISIYKITIVYVKK